MKSAVATSYELDDPIQAARELAQGIAEKLPHIGNGVGILFCDADLDGATVTGELKKELGIEVAGFTTLAEISPDGRLELAAVLTVMAGDDTVFATASTPAMSADNWEQAIREGFGQVLPATDEPGLVISLCPCGMPFSGDSYANVLYDMNPVVPLIGGVASDDYDFERARVFLSGCEYKDSMVAVGIFGGIRPVFAVRHVTSRLAERVRRITKSEGTVVRTVGDESFIEYLQAFGLDTNTDDPLMAFTSFPLMLTNPNSSEVPIMRHIGGLNHEDGSGTFLGNVPEGLLANLCMINVENLTDSCRESMQALLDNPHADTGYSTIFCFSCCGRAIILGDNRNAEGEILRTMLPAGVSLAGAYCLGELCPANLGEGTVANRFHNCSITFCMF